jgi:phage-related protein
VLEIELSHEILRKKPLEQIEHGIEPLLMKKELHWRQLFVVWSHEEQRGVHWYWII